MPIITIRIMGGADTLKTEGLMFKSVCMGHMRVGCQVELPVIGIHMVWAKGSKMVCIIGPRSHKAFKAKGARGKAWKDIKQVSGDNVGELRDNSGGRWGHIPGLGGRVSIGGRRKSRARLRM